MTDDIHTGRQFADDELALFSLFRPLATHSRSVEACSAVGSLDQSECPIDRPKRIAELQFFGLRLIIDLVKLGDERGLDPEHRIVPQIGTIGHEDMRDNRVITWSLDDEMQVSGAVVSTAGLNLGLSQIFLVNGMLTNSEDIPARCVECIDDSECNCRKAEAPVER